MPAGDRRHGIPRPALPRRLVQDQRQRAGRVPAGCPAGAARLEQDRCRLWRQTPVPYDRDSGFAASLAEVGAVYAKAAAEIERNGLVAAHDTLEQVREVMAGLRQRNQVIVYSDQMNAYHAQMEHVLLDGGKMLAEPNGLLQLIAQVGALDYLAGRLKSKAPADYRQSEEFSVLYQAVEKSVADLKAALFAQDVGRVKEAMGKIKGPYSKMFIKFG